MFPSFQEGQVIAVDPQKRRLIVQLASAQVVVVRVGYHGPADAVRVSHKPLPGRGTWGLVAFPYGDDRAGIWVCSTYPCFMDALTTDTDPFMDYDAHWSGAYELMNQNGEWTKSFPDGTFFSVSGSIQKVSTYRHTVDQDQNQQLTLFPDSERIPNPPSPYYIFINHSSGTTNETDPSGNVTVTGAPSQATLTLAFGGATLVVDNNGNITGTAASGSQVQLNANGGSVTINDSGGIAVNAASGQNMKVSAGGAATSYTLVRTDLLMQAFNNHVHTYNDSDTSVPTVPLTAAGIESTMTDVSE